ncbi:hypothetical protein U9M48_008687 [Paspalum notatum var. saurae]|uniref:DUF4218 domain-containing protein n=1 Tax=Paspalum notatum var. saurae TaxID=547442 RepID=A0AAQ3SPM6_PASNO
MDKCPVCAKKRAPRKILRYFPLTPRLERLYMRELTSLEMRWHKVGLVRDGKLRRPADSMAWKHVDHLYPDFASDPRHVRLGLASDGFNPFGMMNVTYSTWPVILIPYNLSPWLCLKQPFWMMSMLIPGPKSPGNNIDVYLEPLIDELKQLWTVGVEAWDAKAKTNFTLRAVLLWTINDFPAYGMLSGWSTKVNHKWRQNKTSFNNKAENRAAPVPLSGAQVLQQYGITLCRLEMVFPPAFFDIMMHLPLHLAEEAKLAGPVCYRLMYPIERYLRTLKGYVCNKSHPEGSIAEGYISKECMTFCSRFLDDVDTKLNRPERHEGAAVAEPPSGLSIFGKIDYRKRGVSIETLSEMEMQQIRHYLLTNCDEAITWVIA